MVNIKLCVLLDGHLQQSFLSNTSLNTGHSESVIEHPSFVERFGEIHSPTHTNTTPFSTPACQSHNQIKVEGPTVGYEPSIWLLQRIQRTSYITFGSISQNGDLAWSWEASSEGIPKHRPQKDDVAVAKKMHQNVRP